MTSNFYNKLRYKYFDDETNRFYSCKSDRMSRIDKTINEFTRWRHWKVKTLSISSIYDLQQILRRVDFSNLKNFFFFLGIIILCNENLYAYFKCRVTISIVVKPRTIIIKYIFFFFESMIISM